MYFHIDPLSPQSFEKLGTPDLFHLKVSLAGAETLLQKKHANLQTLESVIGIILDLKTQHQIVNGFGSDIPTTDCLYEIISLHYECFFKSLRSLALNTFTLKESFVALFLFHVSKIMENLASEGDDSSFNIKTASHLIKHAQLASEAYAEFFTKNRWAEHTLDDCSELFDKAQLFWRPVKTSEMDRLINNNNHQRISKAIESQEKAWDSSRKWEEMAIEYHQYLLQDEESRSRGGKNKKRNSKNFAIKWYIAVSYTHLTLPTSDLV